MEIDCNINSPVVSIVIPVYNTVSYLKRCIESVINQSYTNWELILVDDGSTDGSSAICDEYASCDSRIKVVHKNNGGVSLARNKGIKIASGEWICFVDSDDMISSSYLSHFSDNIKSQFVVLTNYETEFFGKRKSNFVGGNRNYTREQYTQFLENYIENPVIKTVHSMFFVKKIIENNKLSFNSKIRVGEDHIFVLDYLNCVNTVSIIKGSGYIYFLPLEFNLKYSEKLYELRYKFEIMEERIRTLMNKYHVDLDWAIRSKWQRGLSHIDIFDLYDSAIFEKYLELYSDKVDTSYEKDVMCNREARTAQTLIQISKSCKEEDNFNCLLSLLIKNVKFNMLNFKDFSVKTNFVLFAASTNLVWFTKKIIRLL